MVPASSKEFFDIQANYKVWIHSETLMWRDNKIQLKNSVVKKTLILRDSIIKNVDGWILNRRMKWIVSVRSISGATTNAMKHHVMDV